MPYSCYFLMCARYTEKEESVKRRELINNSGLTVIIIIIQFQRIVIHKTDKPNYLKIMIFLFIGLHEKKIKESEKVFNIFYGKCYKLAINLKKEREIKHHSHVL